MTAVAAFGWLTEGNNLRFILEGFLINLEIAVVAIVLALIAGLGLALLRLSRNRVLSVAAGAWIDVFRNLPLLLLILFLFLWIPQSARDTWEDLRRMVPATVSQLITLTKDTTLVSIIAIVEVMRRARTVTATSGNPFTGGGTEAPILEVFLFVGVLFIIFNYTLSRLSRQLEIREKKRSGTKPDLEVRGLEEQVA
jgi:His/Glu/Gln/Arg/opine family amino acid ABC transporter permease subunit